MKDKHYLLIDCYDDKKELKTFNELKELHIEEIISDLIDNRESFDIVRIDADTLGEYAKGKVPTLEEIKENLESYGYKIIDLLDLQRDLEDMKQYLEKNYYTSAFDEVIAKINDEVNK